MLNGGDEFRRTQGGNNNAYCQHNEISWYDWRSLQKYADIFQFTKHLIALRKAHPVFQRTTFFTGSDLDGDQFRDVHWYDPDGHDATWEPSNRFLMCTMDGAKNETGADEDDVDVLMMFNPTDKARLFHLPPTPHQQHWWLAIDTSLPYPLDIRLRPDSRALKISSTYLVKPRSVVVMFSSWQRVAIA
jgi:glycogen operon protein